MDELRATRELLDRQVREAIATDPLAALPAIAEIHKDTGDHLREAVAAATAQSSWSQIADAIGVSKQAAHQRFKTYAQQTAHEIKTQHRTMKRARRRGDAEAATQARARRDELVEELKSAAGELKNV